MKNYINQRLYSDVISWLVTDLDLEGGKAMAVEVEKNCKHESVAGGFCANFPNLHQEFANCEPTIVKGAKPFPIERRGDTWGYWTKKLIFSMEAKYIANLDEVLAQEDTRLVVQDGIEYVAWYKLSKKGKISKTFVKLGKLSNTCNYFYDLNF